MLLINAEGMIFGRLASYCAKRALQKDEIAIVNAEKAIITGSKEGLLKKFHTRFGLTVKGNPRKGPNASRMPDRMLRDAINGMLPRNRRTGRDAIARVKVFIGMPEKFRDGRFVSLDEFRGDRSREFIELGELAKLLGAKW